MLLNRDFEYQVFEGAQGINWTDNSVNVSLLKDEKP